MSTLAHSLVHSFHRATVLAALFLGFSDIPLFIFTR